MTCVGNDIIDLQFIDVSRTNNPAFYSKFLAGTEHELYRQLSNQLLFEQFAWLLWSVKESVYKCIQRHQSDAVFSPVNTRITHVIPPLSITDYLDFPFHQKGTPPACFKCTVEYNGEMYWSRSFIYQAKLIYTIARPQNDFENVHWGINEIEKTDAESQSGAVRGLMLSHLKFFFPSDKLTVVKHPSGYPYLTVNNQAVNMPCSFSHHGVYVAYAFILPGTD